MVKISAEYVGELRCRVTHGPSGNVLETDAPVDNKGKGETFSPTDMLAVSLGTCMLTLMGIQADAMKVDITGTRMEVTKEMASDTPRRIGKITVDIYVPGAFDEREQGRLERAAKACPVHHSLHPDIEQVMTFHWG